VALWVYNGAASHLLQIRKTPPVNQTLRGALFGISASAIWGGLFVLSDEVLRFIPPFTLMMIRLLMGAGLFGVILRAQRRLRLPLRSALPLMGVGIIGYGVGVGAQFVGIDLSTGANGSVITSAAPVFTVLLAWRILHEPLPPLRIVAVALTMIGVMIVVDVTKFSLSSQTAVGDLFLVVAGVLWGLYSVLVRRYASMHDTLVITFYALVGALLVMIPAAAVFEWPRFVMPQITPELVLAILYLGFVAMAFAGWLWNRAFALVEASVASLFLFAQPLVGVLLSNWLLRQPVTPNLLIGGGLIGLGVILSLTGEGQTAPAPQDSATPADEAV